MTIHAFAIYRGIFWLNIHFSSCIMTLIQYVMDQERSFMKKSYFKYHVLSSLPL